MTWGGATSRQRPNSSLDCGFRSSTQGVPLHKRMNCARVHASKSITVTTTGITHALSMEKCAYRPQNDWTDGQKCSLPKPNSNPNTKPNPNHNPAFESLNGEEEEVGTILIKDRNLRPSLT